MLGISIRTLRNKLHEYRAAGAAVPPVPGQAPLRPAGRASAVGSIALPGWLRRAQPGNDMTLALRRRRPAGGAGGAVAHGAAGCLAGVSITISVLVLMVALFLRRPLDFTSFPTLLLLTTLLRLALNVATTRTILTHGHEGEGAAGHVVSAFGGFLMGGDVVVGLIVFAILLVVNFMVITKGSGRIAEVAARFSLDALPGKQMAIDADLSAGLVERDRGPPPPPRTGGGDRLLRRHGRCREIRPRRCHRRADHHRHQPARRHGDRRCAARACRSAEAAQTFSVLTVGDGLVSQIPSLLVSVAAGIVVTKGSTEGTADEVMLGQLGAGPKPLGIAAGVAAMMALLPGMPMLPFLALAGWRGGRGLGDAQARQRRRRSRRTRRPSPPSRRSPRRCASTCCGWNSATACCRSPPARRRG